MPLGVVQVRAVRRTSGGVLAADAGLAEATGTAPDASTVLGSITYIAPTGDDDAGAGTFASPWKTIQKWVSTAPAAGATLYCRGGSYLSPPMAAPGRLTEPALVGTETSPITIMAYPGETPIFSGGGSDPWLWLAGTSSWVVVDGLQVFERTIWSGGVLHIGGYDTNGRGGAYETTNITVRNCTFTQNATIYYAGHMIYVSGGAQYVTIEDCVFLGKTTGSLNETHSGVQVYGGDGGDHEPAPTDILVQRCIFDGFEVSALILWDEGLQTLRAAALHNTFVDSGVRDLRAERHGAITVRDNATDALISATTWRDPYDYVLTNGGATFASYFNFGSQAFDADYYLVAGQTGIDAASDGKDAGALDTAPSSTANAQLASASAVAYNAGQAYEAAVLADSPTFVVPLDEASGTITDIVGSKTATISGSPTYGITGPVTGHTAMNFSGSPYLSFADHADLDLGTGALSIELWFKAGSTGSSMWLIAKGTHTPGLYYTATTGIVKWRAYAWDDAVQSNVGITDTTTWHHIVGTKSSGNAWKIYLDGTDVTDTGGIATTTADTSTSLYIGSSSAPDNYVNGGLAYVALYKSELSAARVLAHYNARTSG